MTNSKKSMSVDTRTEFVLLVAAEAIRRALTAGVPSLHYHHETVAQLLRALLTERDEAIGQLTAADNAVVAAEARAATAEARAQEQISQITRVAHDCVAAQNRVRELEARVQALEAYQPRVRAWCLSCFGEAISDDRTERSFRFLEEALELVQSLGCTEAHAQRLVGYVFGRPVGATPQEVGGVLVTLAALTSAIGVDMAAEGERELARVLRPEVTANIRRKQAAKRGVVSHVAEAALPGEWNADAQSS